MLKGKQKKLDVNKDGKISGEDFALLKPKKASLGALIGMGADKILKNSETARDIVSYTGLGGNMLSNYYNDLDDKKVEEKSIKQQVTKAESGKMITEAEAPDLEGALSGGALGAIGELLTPDRISEVDTAMAEEAIRNRPLPMLKEYKRKPITPKERRERDIAKRETIKAYKSQMEKKTRGRMLQDPMSYKQGGAVRGGRKEIKGLRPAKLF
jgi:hypothetical protein